MRTFETNIGLATVAVGIALLATGCVSTFKEVKPLSVGPPPATRPTLLAVGEVKITDGRISAPEQQVMAHALELGLEKWCVEHKALELLPSSAVTNLPSSTIVLDAAICEIEEGSPAARFWVGMGAGQQRVVGEFAVRDPDGTRLLAFTARKSYLGGQGIGGWDMLKVRDLVDQLGQLAAQTTDRWLRGQKLD